MPLSRAARWGLRVLVCAGAIAGGALFAHFTQPAYAAPTQVAPPEGEAPPAVRAFVELDADAMRIEPVVAPPEAQPAGERTPALASTLRDGMVITGDTPHRMVLFSFDDGPDHRYTRHLLDQLQTADVRALFFLSARRFEGSTPRERELADIAREIVARGHYVGSHGMDHLQLPTLDGIQLAEQIEGTERVFERVLGERPFLVRPPGGARSLRVDTYLASRGYTQVLWNLGSGDFQVRTAEEVVHTWQRVLDRRERDEGMRGGIVLLHDIHAWSVEAFPRIVEWLDDRNCELLADGDELYDIVDDPSLFFVPRDGASPDVIAPPAMPEPAVLAARQARARARAEAHCARVASPRHDTPRAPSVDTAERTELASR